MADLRVRAAEGRRQSGQSKPVGEDHPGILAAMGGDRDDGAEPRSLGSGVELPPGEPVPGMVGQAGVVDGPDGRMPRQPRSQQQRGRTLPAHPKRQSLKSAAQEVGVIGPE
jgi:hypothetical protein